MIKTLTGPNSLVLKQELRKLLDDFISEHGDLAVEKLEGDEATVERTREALTSVPFLASKKMVVLDRPSANKQFTEAAEELIKNLPESTDLLIVEPKLDKRLQYYKLLKRVTDFKEFTELDTNGLSSWLVDYAKEKGGKINPSDARYLIERTGTNQLALSNEIEKLLIYDTQVNRSTIDLLTDPAPASTIFELLESAFNGRTKKAMELYSEQRSQKVEPQQIIAMLSWQLGVLAIIKTAGDKSIDEIAKEARLNPFVVRKSATIARGLTLTEVKGLVADLLKIDMQSKRTNLDIDDALQHYLLKLAG